MNPKITIAEYYARIKNNPMVKKMARNKIQVNNDEIIINNAKKMNINLTNQTINKLKDYFIPSEVFNDVPDGYFSNTQYAKILNMSRSQVSKIMFNLLNENKAVMIKCRQNMNGITKAIPYYKLL